MIGNVVVRNYKFRLYPSKKVADVMERTLDGCRFLYNAELEYEKQAYFSERRFVSRVYLNSLIPDWRVINSDLRWVHSQVLQDVSDRLSKAFKNFFKGIEHCRRAGFPRFKSKDRYDSFTFPQSGFKLKGNMLRLSKIGAVNIKLHREIIGKVKTLTIKKSRTSKWFACFTVIVEKKVRKREIKECAGVDVGLNGFYADSEGNIISNPRWFRKSEERLAFLQKKHSKKQEGSNNCKKWGLKIARLHERIVNQRNDFLHKESRKLVNRYSFVAVEKISINTMVRNRYLSKSIYDASWNRFLQFLAYKAEETGSQIIEIKAWNTSQYCICGNKVKKSLAVRTHKCTRCGLELDRDVVSALVIRLLALDFCTVGTAGINACGDVPRGMSVKQEVNPVDTTDLTP